MPKRPETQEEVFVRVESELNHWVQKAARMKLLGEDLIPTYRPEYERCLEIINAKRRCLARREAYRRSSITKASP